MHQHSGSRKQQIQALLEEDPNDHFLWFAMAQEELKSDAFSKAAMWFQKLVEEAPDEIGTYYHYAKLLFSENQQQRAVGIIRLGIERGLKKSDHHAVSELKQLLISHEEE